MTKTSNMNMLSLFGIAIPTIALLSIVFSSGEVKSDIQHNSSAIEVVVEKDIVQDKNINELEKAVVEIRNELKNQGKNIDEVLRLLREDR